ncbi:MAG: acetate/propionate family kinase [Burkholderiaceae bacterium]|jgi:acetate kinase|nr:acetate/propionate family kinase [Burkholderiaceae bacterium]
MKNPILVLNAGSSSLKFSIYEKRDDHTLAAGAYGQAEGLSTQPHLVVKDPQGETLVDEAIAAHGHRGAIDALQSWFSSHLGEQGGFAGIGHRVVHGGQRFVAPVRINAEVLATVEALTPLAPLHQPHHIATIRAVTEIAPDVVQVACFDTAFHATIPMIEREFALPHALTQQGIVRYGFHGLSYEYIATALAGLDATWKQRRTIVAHLGNGSSLCALANGQSVATTMGLSSVDGLVMGTRTGALDPGALLYLMRQGRSVDEVERLIYKESGLLGVSEVSSDVRELLQSRDPQAAHAIDLFNYRAAREIAALAGVLGGLDTLVFTGGIGEHAATVRSAICKRAGWLGVALDEQANAANAAIVSSPQSAVTVRVIATDENLMIARHTLHFLEP